MSGPRIALIVGGDEQKRLPRGERVFIDNRGSTDVHKLGDFADGQLHFLQVTRDYFRHTRRHRFTDYDLLINSITDADQNGRVLEVLDKALKGVGVAVLNPPAAVLGTTRERVARRLGGIEGLIVPRVRAIRKPSAAVLRGLNDSGAMGFPAIVRPAGTHAGRGSMIVAAPDQPPEVERGADSFYLTEFVDFRSDDGLYRKFRVFLFGGIPVFRHQVISDHWNVHVADRERFMMARPALLDESLAFYADGAGGFDPRHRAIFTAIAERLALDFFGIDFAILPDGRMVLFEANATMNFFPLSDDPRLAAMQACLAPAKAAFRALVTRRAGPASQA